MDQYGTQILAAQRHADFVREADTERRAGLVRRRARDSQAEPRSAPRQQEAARPAIA